LGQGFQIRCAVESQLKSHTNHSLAANSLLNRENTGNFCDFGPRQEVSRVGKSSLPKVFGRIPYFSEEGISKTEQGINSSDQPLF
jgi:hypothetical protein